MNKIFFCIILFFPFYLHATEVKSVEWREGAYGIKTYYDIRCANNVTTTCWHSNYENTNGHIIFWCNDDDERHWIRLDIVNLDRLAYEGVAIPFCRSH